MQGYVSAMNAAEQCIQNITNANTAAFWATITNMALIAGVGLTGYAFFKAYLNRPGGPGVVRSGSEARNAMRDSNVQEEADAGNIDSAEAADSVTANAAAAQAEAATEADALQTTATEQLAAAEAASDEALITQINTFEVAEIEEVAVYSADAEDFFAALFE